MGGYLLILRMISAALFPSAVKKILEIGVSENKKEKKRKKSHGGFEERVFFTH